MRRGRGAGDYATSASLPLIQADDVDVKFPCARQEALGGARAAGEGEPSEIASAVRGGAGRTARHPEIVDLVRSWPKLTLGRWTPIRVIPSHRHAIIDRQDGGC